MRASHEALQTRLQQFETLDLTVSSSEVRSYCFDEKQSSCFDEKQNQVATISLQQRCQELAEELASERRKVSHLQRVASRHIDEQERLEELRAENRQLKQELQDASKQTDRVAVHRCIEEAFSDMLLCSEPEQVDRASVRQRLEQLVRLAELPKLWLAKAHAPLQKLHHRCQQQAVAAAGRSHSHKGGGSLECALPELFDPSALDVVHSLRQVYTLLKHVAAVLCDDPLESTALGTLALVQEKAQQHVPQVRACTTWTSMIHGCGGHRS